MSATIGATLHDGILEHIARDHDREVRLVIDVPHVRAHHGLPKTARFVLRLTGGLYLAVMRWYAPETTTGLLAHAAADEAREPIDANVVQNARQGTMRSIDWDAFAAQIEAPGTRADITEVNVVVASEPARVAIEIWGSFGPKRAVDEHRLRLEADTLAFEHDTGEVLDAESFAALGKSYWDGWSASRRSGE